MAVSSIILDIIGKDNASHAFKKVSEEAEKSGHSFKGWGIAAVAATAAATAGVLAFAKSSIDKFEEVGKQTLQLQRVMGGTAESASRMRFAAQESSVDFDAFAKSVGIFSKHLETANDGGKAGAKIQKELGVSIADTHGKLKPTNDILLELADRFKAMPAGAEKTALALQLFGRGGADMLKFLNKGSEGLKELMAESDKTGNTLSGKNLDDIKKSIQAHKEFSAAVDGLKIQFGAALLPILNQVVEAVDRRVIPAVQNATHWLGKHKDVVKDVAIGLGVAGAAFAVFTAAMAINPVMLAVTAIGALAAGVIYAYNHSHKFHQVVDNLWNNVLKPFGSWLATEGVAAWHSLQEAAHWVADKFEKDLRPALQRLWDKIQKDLLPVLRDFGQWFVDHQQQIKDVSDKVGEFSAAVGKVALNGLVKDLSSTADALGRVFDAVGKVTGALDSLNKVSNGGLAKGAISGLTGPLGAAAQFGHDIGLFANGGRPPVGQLSIVGERGPELFVPDGPGTIIPNHALNSGGSGSPLMDRQQGVQTIREALRGLTFKTVDGPTLRLV